MNRKERIDLYLEYINKHEGFLSRNAIKLDIYEGNLLPYVDDIMRKTVSKNYYDKIKERIIPINVLTRIIDKLSKVYINEPMRKDDNYQEFIDKVISESSLNVEMSLADTYSHLFKGYALEPYLEEGEIKIRVLPYDRFIPLSLDNKNQSKMTDFIKSMGKKGDLKVYFAYTNDEFFAFNEKGEELLEYYDGNGGINPLGRIPAVYGNRSRQSIVPTEDTDIVQMTKMIPVLLSDLAGAIMFQCFTVIYGIDVSFENLTLSPNAFWSLKTDSKSENARPEIGTIKPEADIDKVLSFIKQSFAFWLETKGVRIGSLNSIDAGNAASGISKIIDEMDVYEIKKTQIQFFKKEEKELWSLLKELNNMWLSDSKYQSSIIGDDFSPQIIFDEPRPEIGREQMVRTIDAEYKGGYLDALSAIKQLYPDLEDNEAQERAIELDSINNRGEIKEEVNGVDKNQDKAAEEI